MMDEDQQCNFLKYLNPDVYSRMTQQDLNPVAFIGDFHSRAPQNSPSASAINVPAMTPTPTDDDDDLSQQNPPEDHHATRTRSSWACPLMPPCLNRGEEESAPLIGARAGARAIRAAILLLCLVLVVAACGLTATNLMGKARGWSLMDHLGSSAVVVLVVLIVGLMLPVLVGLLRRRAATCRARRAVAAQRTVRRSASQDSLF